MVDGDARAAQLTMVEVAMQKNPVIALLLVVLVGLLGNAVQVAIVIAKDEVYRVDKPGSELIQNEWRAQVPAADENVRVMHIPQGSG